MALAATEGTTHVAVLLIELGAILFILGVLGRIARIPVIPLYLIAGLFFGVAALAVGAGAEAKLGPLAACYVLLTIVLAPRSNGLPDRLTPDPTPPRPVSAAPT